MEWSGGGRSGGREEWRWSGGREEWRSVLADSLAGTAVVGPVEDGPTLPCSLQASRLLAARYGVVSSTN